MPSGYKVKINGVDTDLDSIFKARSTAATANVGFSTNGADISNRYEKIPSGYSGYEIAYNTNFKSSGTDLRYIFVDINY